MHRAAARIAVIVLAVCAGAARASTDAGDVRALWVVRTTLASPAAIDRMVDAAREAGFNTLLVQVRGRGDAYFSGGLDPRPPLLSTDRGFDPLQTVTARAHAAGLRVHAWVNVNLVAGAGELPTARDHIVYRHPEWLMVPRALAEDLATTDPRSPAYVDRLLRHVRAHASELEGLYISPVSPAAVAYTTAVVRDIAERYPIDGVHLDYVRYPTDAFDYSRDALDAFRRDVAADLTTSDRSRLDGRRRADPLVYARTFAERWRLFRSARLTALVNGLSAAIRAARPEAVVSAAVVPDADDAAERRLQDWRQWIDTGAVDVVCPMAYTTDPDRFAAQIDRARHLAGRERVWAGIGAYRLTPAQTVANIRAAQRLGVGGVILFSYDSLTGRDRGDYLGLVGRAAFATQ